MDKFNNKRLLSLKEFEEYVGLGKTLGIPWAKKIGAVKRIGRRLLFDRVVIDRGIDDLAASTDQE